MGKQPKRTRKGTVIHIRLSEEIHEKIRAMSAAEDRTMNNICVRLVRMGLEKLEAAK